MSENGKRLAYVARKGRSGGQLLMAKQARIEGIMADTDLARMANTWLTPPRRLAVGFRWRRESGIDGVHLNSPF
jgi:hypothetical protein